jgi:hypothetical protein
MRARTLEHAQGGVRPDFVTNTRSAESGFLGLNLVCKRPCGPLR